MKIKYLVWLAAFLLAACAAIISVKGLALLFGGGLILYFIFGTMEGIKLITAGVLERFWLKLPKTLRTYLVGGVGILMLITSLGVYGFFSGNYQGVADQLTIEDGKIEMIENRIAVFEERKISNKELIVNKTESLTSLTENANELSKGLSNNVIQYKDSDGNIITTTSSSTRKTLERQLDDVNENIKKLNVEIDELLTLNSAISDSIIVNKGNINEIRANSDITAEVGPLRYLSDITGLPMGNVVNILMMLIVFVFDPMAISLVILANKLDEIDSGKKPKIKKGEFKDTITAKNLETETFEDDMVDDVQTITVEPVKEEPKFVEPIEVEEENSEISYTSAVSGDTPSDGGWIEKVWNNDKPVKEESKVDGLVDMGKKVLKNLVKTEQPVKKQPIIPKGKITQEDVPQIKEGLNRGFSVKVPERKKKQ